MNGGIFQIFRRGRFKLNSLTFNIMRLFYGGEQGVWYDPSDMSTLFQDAAGTIPVTAVEQPVGRILDKSGRGNHATQSTTTKRPVLSRRVNLLTYSEDAINWVGSNSTVLSNQAIAPDGTLTMDRITANTATGYRYQNLQCIAGAAYTQQCVLKAGTLGEVRLGFAGSAFTGGNFALFNLINGSVSSVESGVTASIENIGGGLYRCVATKTASFSSNGVLRVQAGAGWVSSSAGDWYAWGWQAEMGSGPSTYQWVNTATDYDADPAKFPAYLRFDGVDDALQTGNIDFTSTDKMTVWAGVTKLSDAASSILLESSDNTNNNPGSFYIAAPETPGSSSLSFRSRGSVSTAPMNLYGHAAPISRVVAAIGDIGGDISTIRAGGGSATNPQDQGTGNYGNYPLYIGARAGTSIFFNGRLYSLIVRGAQTPLSQIEATEAYIKQKMRMP